MLRELSMNERLEAVVHGRVQMVMFRDFSMRKARGLGLVGEVQNVKDGTVRITAEGPREKLEAYALKLEKGPLLAKVERVDVSYVPALGTFTNFSIRYE